MNRLLFGKQPEKTAEPNVNHIKVITSSIMSSFTAIDSVHVVASQEGGLRGVELDSIFELVKHKLRLKCYELGGDAVISCHFSERAAHSGGIVASQVIEIWAYGTVVKLG